MAVAGETRSPKVSGCAACSVARRPSPRAHRRVQRLAAGVGGVAAGRLAYRLVVQVLICTVLFEELAFRGLLYALLVGMMGQGSRLAMVGTTASFGLWHSALLADMFAGWKIGRRLARLARTTQYIVVTHLPQGAAYADLQRVVDSAGRNGASVVRRLDDEDRVAELARMLAGLGDSDSGRAQARELLSAAHEDRDRAS